MSFMLSINETLLYMLAGMCLGIAVSCFLIYLHIRHVRNKSIKEFRDESKKRRKEFFKGDE